MKSTKSKIVDRSSLQSIVQGWKNEGKKVVFTNGCFDILHLGHVDYLEKARQRGDKLVLGLNTDSSVKRLKGKDRPLNDQYARARLLASLAFVDALTYFDEDTPYELIKELKPDILVKGNDYLAENIVGADIVVANGGKVETIALVEGFSTSNIIEKIKQQS
ncbi:D-glycero-beta-D-manno-heptose 1-phosphate adenylyltransferase [Fulvivirga sp. 29W222]|uniref:D-glycero-beta-D-manno-heptose 1-phosphate adenylyltransferase n=1 Tax=Fulvivirga marina TaxID=2494733 RepID=A0A937KEK8_9BACT|nr:D-glycero-beta-D-manno-heptose 1-phosphate adenylyltransferase [Fulvivirga marina]MBL6449689.1 D-glycero-beta-D-manno-heptose 1-phosphate adenylyltransferase [Fulvivirga marina]